jgi:hypothetical protein
MQLMRAMKARTSTGPAAPALQRSPAKDKILRALRKKK